MTDTTDTTDLLALALSPQGARAHAAKAREAGQCIRCRKKPVLRTEIERREYGISAICGPCWDAIFPPEDSD